MAGSKELALLLSLLALLPVVEQAGGVELTCVANRLCKQLDDLMHTEINIRLEPISQETRYANVNWEKAGTCLVIYWPGNW